MRMKEKGTERVIDRQRETNNLREVEKQIVRERENLKNIERDTKGEIDRQNEREIVRVCVCVREIEKESV